MPDNVKSSSGSVKTCDVFLCLGSRILVPWIIVNCSRLTEHAHNEYREMVFGNNHIDEHPSHPSHPSHHLVNPKHLQRLCSMLGLHYTLSSTIASGELLHQLRTNSF